MAADEQLIRSLRDALAVSPDNAPVRQLLGEALLKAGRPAEAEAELRAALALSPGNPAVKEGLARAFHAQSKHSQALVVLEDLTKSPEASAGAHLLYARLLLGAGELGAAQKAYRRALALDSACADEVIEAAFGEAHADESVVDGRVRLRHTEAPEAIAVAPERPAVTFDDVGGMEEIKQEIRLKILAPLQHPELYAAYGKTAGGGILMYGPPGCGKTHLARATAGEAAVNFMAVGLHEILDMWIGQSERNLHEVFEQARAQAPCVLFFDEVDALGASRSDLRHSAGRQVINQFLSELDGVSTSNEGVLVLAATNAPWHLDGAFRRPGRFDRMLFVPPPDFEGRVAILKLLLAGKPQGELDFKAIAKQSEHFSGADLKAAVDRAIEAKLEAAMRTGKPEPLVTKDLLAGVKAQVATTREWFQTAKNHALYANQGGTYDPVLAYLKAMK